MISKFLTVRLCLPHILAQAFQRMSPTLSLSQNAVYLRTPLCFDGKCKASLMWKFQYTFHLGIVQDICSQNQSIYLIPENLYYSMWSPSQRPDFCFLKFSVPEYHPEKLVENADWSMPSSQEVSAEVVGKSELRNIRKDIPSFQMLAIWSWIDYHTWF